MRNKGILSEVWKHKLLFVETPDAMETSIALKNFREVSLSLCHFHVADRFRLVITAAEQYFFP
jgi:hypothetical protein